MRRLILGLVIAVGIVPASGLAQAPAPPQPKVQLTFEPNGLVSLTATEATIREVLAEWTRKGGTTFPGAEKLGGKPVNLQFEHRPETEVVGSLLRDASGYVLGPRDLSSVGASQLGTVYVVATSNATMVSGGYSQPAYTQPQMSTSGNPDQEIAPAGPGRSGEPPQGAPPAPAPAPRPAGVGPIAVQVVPVTPVATPPPNGGRGGGGGNR